MFVQRDLRKIDEILLDTSADKRLLKFSNRKAEFGGNLRVLCSESKVMLLTALETLNIYSNELTNLQGIGLLSYTPLRELNLGCNKISSLPLEVCLLFASRIIQLLDAFIFAVWKFAWFMFFVVG